MLKRTLSVLLTFAIIATLLVPAMSVSANTETIDIEDYTTGDKPASLTLSNFGGNSICGFTTTRDKVNGVYAGTYTVSAPETADFTGTNANFQSAVAMPSVGFWATYGSTAFVKDKTYVLSFEVKNANPEVPTKVVYGLVDGSMGGSSQNYAWKGQWVYAEDVTSSEWKTVNKTISINLNSTASTQLQIGLGMGNTHNSYKNNAELALVPNSVLTVNNNSVYIAEEVVYDIENTLSATKVLPGATVTGNAKVVNQLGEKSGLDQAMTYFVTDESGVIAEGFTVTPGEDGAYEVAVGDSVADGNYVVLARSSAYNTDKTENLLQAPVTLTVKSEDYSDTADLAVASSLVSGASSSGFDTFGVTWANTTDKIYSFTAAAPQNSIPASIDAPAGGMVWSLADKGITRDDKYIITFRVKKNADSTEGEVPNLVYGLVDGAMGGEGDYGWKAQTVYTMDVTSSDWYTVVTEAIVPRNASKNVKFILGLGVGSTRTEYKGKAAFEFRDGASILVDMDSLCLVKDGVKGIVNNATTSTNVYAGGKIEAKAAVVNSANLTGDLDQTIEYAVLDSATRQKPASGITVTVGENGNYTVNVSKSAAAGDYVVVASNSTNGSVMRKGLEFTVDTIDKYTTDYEPGTKPANLTLTNFGGTSICGFTSERDRTAHTYTITAPETADFTGTNASFQSAVAAPTAGFWATYDASSFVSGNTYVISFRVKNANPEVPAKVVFGLVDGTQGGSAQNYAWKGQWVWAEDVTGSDWQTITKTVDINLNGSASTQLQIGLGIGNQHSAYKNNDDFALVPNASIIVDENPYIALQSESAYDMKVSAENTTIRSGGTLTANAAAVNQVGDESTFSQNFSWVALNSAKTDVAEGITVTTGADTSVATVSVDEDVAEGTYVIAAYNEEYDMAKSMVITVSNKVSVENIALDTANSKVTFDALNVPNDEFGVKVYIAEYTEAGKKLVQAEEVPVVLSKGNNIGAKAIYTKDINTDNLIKIFVWESDLTPLAEEVEVKKN